MGDFFSKQDPKNKGFLSKNDLGWRLLIALVGVVCLTLFLHFRETKVEILELNATASRYVVAQVDFEFPDEEATVILKQDAVRGVGYIYKIPNKDLRHVNYDFENFLVRNTEWKKIFPSATFDEIYEVADAFEDFVENVRFGDARTIQKIKDLNIAITNYLVFSPEVHIDPQYMPTEYWQHIRNIFLEQLNEKDTYTEKTVDLIVDYYKKRKWPLTKDRTTNAYLRQVLQKKVSQKFTRIESGATIVNQGEKISQRHIAMLQAMKKTLRETRHLLSVTTLIGNLLMAVIFVVLTALYLWVDQRKIFKSLQQLSLFVCIMILTFAFAKILEYVFLQETFRAFSKVDYPIIVPFASILIMMLLNARLALISTFFLSIILAATLAISHNKFLLINLVTSLIAIFTSGVLRKRKDVFITCGKSFLGVIPVIFAFSFGGNKIWNVNTGFDIFSSAIFLTIIAIVVVGLLPLLELLFHVMTDISLMEYTDPNNPLLRRLTMEMPGTYQHSLVLGNIAESAAQSIGANGLLCRVATLYHDIGKLNNLNFFTENQEKGVNIHQLLTPIESARVIIGHIKDGEMLAKKHHLPQAFIDIIREHHGTTLVYYFYCEELKLKGEKVEVVDEKLFRYPGPKPQTKEAAIIMIADAAEAASRSLEDPSKQGLTDLLDRVVADKADDKQFDECSITFKELSKVKKTIVNTLMMAHHVRVKYPEKKEKAF